MKIAIKKRPTEALKKLNEIDKNLSRKNDIKIGLPKGSNNYPDGTSVIMIGAVHEFGSPKQRIPERSFLRSSIRDNKEKYLKIVKKAFKKTIREGSSFNQQITKLAILAAADAKKKITDLKEPMIKESTIKRRKASTDYNPLIDTGHLRRSITYKVGD